MQLTIHRGAKEIGGNCIEIATANSRIILDVGMPLFNQDRTPHDSTNLRRQTTEQLRESGILPNVSGLFDEGDPPDAIAVSHAHEDHTGLIRHCRKEIPIYASVGTSKMMLAGSIFAGQPSLPRDRHRKLNSGEPVDIGDFKVTPFSVDHSIYGSQAFLIEGEGKTVLYSGDLRLHGRTGLHRTLLDALKNRIIDMLLIEGTHIEHPDHRGPNEWELENEIAKQIGSAQGLVLASFSPQHVERLAGFVHATRKNDRVFVPDVYSALIMHLIAAEMNLPPPESTEGVRVFVPRFAESGGRKTRLRKFFQLIEPRVIGVEEIRANPAAFAMVFRPSMLGSDFGGTLPEKSRCLYSRWSGYLTQPDWLPVKAALEKSQGDLLEVHTSGHIFGSDIVTFANQIRAKTVVPIHTFEAKRFESVLANVKVLTDGETLEI